MTKPVCPECGKEFDKAVLISICDQYADIEFKDGKITAKDAQPPHYFGDTDHRECPHCMAVLPDDLFTRESL